MTSDSLSGGMVSKGRPVWYEGWDRPWMHDPVVAEKKKKEYAEKVSKAENLGRFPANLIHDGSEEIIGLFPVTTSGGGDKRGGCEFFLGGDKRTIPTGHVRNSGSAARFFYGAKVSKQDRDEGLEDLPDIEYKTHGETNPDETGESNNTTRQRPARAKNHHPTVKPTNLMRYLCRLITPPGGIILDPFMGSGSTGKASMLEGFSFTGIEKEPEYFLIAEKRIQAAAKSLEETQETLPGIDLE
jgi:site-specific DNA-methyltransferase (adenine-specific)